MRHPWFARLLRGRLDPGTATGLALTLALAITVDRWPRRRRARLPGALERLPRPGSTRSVGGWAQRPRRSAGRRSSSSSSPTSRAPRLTILVLARRDGRRDDSGAEPVGAAVPDHGRRRRGPARQRRQAASRPRPTLVQPHRRDPRPLVPERPFRHRSGALRLGGARAGAEALAAGCARCSQAAQRASRSGSPPAGSCSTSTGSRT